MKKQADIEFTWEEADRLLILLEVLTKNSGLKYAQECVYFKDKIDKEFQKETKLNEV